jgi:hypothetical protein
MDSGFTLRVPRNDEEGKAILAMTGETYTGNRAAFSSSGSHSPFARYDTVR